MKKFFLIFFLFVVASVFSQTVYITKTGAKYHQETCTHLKHSSISMNLEEALEKGYEPCKVCKPLTTQEKVSVNNVKTETTTESQTTSTTSVQCSGKTKKGIRCKRKTTNTNGRCYQH
ncbi:hypothetical protein [Flavobacterium soli]|uniref:hypothetical protein n=1 Tax=Flavobacterium soli TaxID=344881 RepID=UPI001B7FBC75|nr:hypothetical protein [Flavobacterium soli]